MPTRTCSTIVLIAAMAFTPRAMSAAVPHIQLGEVATEDVITPVPLVVVDPEATDALREKVALQSPSIVRYAPQTISEVEAELRATVAAAKTKFMTALDALQDHPPTEADIGTAVYTAAVEYTAHSSIKNLPLEQLTPLWLRGKSDQPLVDRLLAPIREVMAQPIVGGAKTDLPLPLNLGVRLVTVKSISDPLSIEKFETTGQTISPTRVLGLSRAQQQVQARFPAGEEQLGEFARSFVRANALYDAPFTDIVRAKRTAGLAVNDTFDAAQIIVRKGQTIDRKALSALAVLREKSMIGTLQNKLDQEQTVVGMIKSQTKWVGAGLAVTVLALILILLRLRSHHSQSMLPAVTDPALAGQSLPGAADEGEWQKRAIEAEGKAERAHEAIRSGALGWMRDKLFRTMFHQRAELLSVQKNAETEMQELEQRLEQLHAPLQDKISSYEQRIKELDGELAAARATQNSTPPPVVTVADPDTVRREIDARLEELKRPLDERMADYQKRILELERDLAATRNAHPSLRPGFAPPADPEKAIRRRELTVAEREQAVAEAEQRAAERERDLNELDALLRAREALLSSSSVRTPARVVAKGTEAVRPLNGQHVSPAVASPASTSTTAPLSTNSTL